MWIIIRSLIIKVKNSLAVNVAIITFINVVITVCFTIPQNHETQTKLSTFTSKSELGKYKTAAISADAEPCAGIGKDIFLKDGSAIDAAIAVLLCMGVVNPQSSGLGGGFLMLHYEKAIDRVHYINAREVAPIHATRDMFKGNATLAKYDGLSIAVPGELAGYIRAHDNFGRLPWKDLFPPTIKMCEEGLRVNSYLARALNKFREEILAREDIRNVFVDKKTGDVFKEGDVYKRLDLAETLKTIAREKQTAIYGHSDITNKFLKDLEKAGSIITMKDLETYIPEFGEPIAIDIRRNMTLYSANLPGSGPLLAFMLNMLDGFDDLYTKPKMSREETVLLLHRIMEAFKFAYAKRMYLEDDDSEETLNLVEKLRQRSYADKIRQKIDDKSTHEPEYYGVNVTLKEDHGTAHLSLVAPNGDAVAVTTTINQYFGSLVMSPSTGILLNDEMDDFSSPGITNYFGVPETGKNYIHPGKRPMSSMTPTIVVDQDRNVRFVVGGNGGTQITTSVAQVVFRNLWLNQTVKEAIDAPRIHHQLLPNYIQHEANFPKDILDDLKKKGHKLYELGANMVGIIMAIARDDNGDLFANSDFRKGGDVDGY